ncbi:TetR/AcrR family transcriptional regulator [Rhizohabitans arisaemae]|uniref:TetR/AcrR family transcriptional regulator n=1 Tax=Rhizohabitans arisaemae TaxID=2720610 RepID=UPI0024B0FAA1|nr:TetR/AcrR family transcriptional regulator [Rhizohabitans arisaemae]
MTKDDQSDDGLPASIELLWGLRERPRRGPKPGLSLGGIVAAAIELVDADGLGALSMARVAERLGFTTMSLYRHVANKEELLLLMVDTALGDKPPLPEPGESWRTAMESWAWGHLAVYRRHPWLIQIPISGPPVGPNHMMWMDAGLRTLVGTPLRPEEKLSVLLLVTGHVWSEVRLSRDLSRAEQETGQLTDEMMLASQRLYEKLTDPERFPALADVVASGVLSMPDEVPDTDFTFGLTTILDGLRKLMESR